VNNCNSECGQKRIMRVQHGSAFCAFRHACPCSRPFGPAVFGGVERGSGRTFLVPVPDRTADTLTALIREWIEPGTTVVSDCWDAYRDLESQGYKHSTWNITKAEKNRSKGPLNTITNNSLNSPEAYNRYF